MVSIYKRIKNHFPILDIAQRYLDIEQRGSAYFACCPFHQEDTPSLSIWTSRGMFKCFGCGEHGDIFDLVMVGEGVTHNEAVKMLATEAGIEYTSNARVDKNLEALDFIVELTSLAARNTHLGDHLRHYFIDEQLKQFKIGVLTSDVNIAAALEQKELVSPVILPEAAVIIPVYNSRAIRGLYFYDYESLEYMGCYMYKPLLFFGGKVTSTRVKFNHKCFITDNPMNVVVDRNFTTYSVTSALTPKHIEHLKGLGLRRLTLNVSEPMYFIDNLHKHFSLNVYDANTGEIMCYLDYIASYFPDLIGNYTSHSKLLQKFYNERVNTNG